MTISKRDIAIGFFVLLSLMNIFKISSVYITAILIVAAFVLMLHNRFYCPKELLVYLLSGLLALVIGVLHSHPISYIMRAAFYYLNGALPIVFGLLFAKRCSLKKIINYIWWIVLIATMYGFFLLVKLGDYSNMMEIRKCLDADLYSLEFFFPIYTMQLFYHKDYVKSKRVDGVVWLIQLLRLLLSFSRTTIIGVGVGIIVQYILLDRYTKTNSGNIIKTIFAIPALLLSVFGLVILLPKDIMSVYFGKMLTVFHEISIENNFSDYGSALANWRSYEIYSAINQFKNGDMLQKIFGTGFGGLVKVDFMSSVWSGMEFYNQGGIPILHNGYFSALSFGGIMGLASYLYFFIKSCFQSLKRRNHGYNRCANTVVCKRSIK